jgi:hypothetical protein
MERVGPIVKEILAQDPKAFIGAGKLKGEEHNNHFPCNFCGEKVGSSFEMYEIVLPIKLLDWTNFSYTVCNHCRLKLIRVLMAVEETV